MTVTGLRLSAYLYRSPSGSSRLVGDQLGSSLENDLEWMVPDAEGVPRHGPLGSMREVSMLPMGTGGCGIIDAIRKGHRFPVCTREGERVADNEKVICRPSLEGCAH